MLVTTDTCQSLAAPAWVLTWGKAHSGRRRPAKSVLQLYWIILTQNHDSSVICLLCIRECR